MTKEKLKQIIDNNIPDDAEISYFHYTNTMDSQAVSITYTNKFGKTLSPCQIQNGSKLSLSLSTNEIKSTYGE